MASRPDNKHGITVTPKQGLPVLILADGAGSAQSLVATINQTDASAVYEGAVRELPMVVNGDMTVEEASATFARDFRRVLTGRKFLGARDVTRVEDETGTYWTASALWSFEELAAAPIEEG
jgi:tRNA-dihydrouridine synthase